MAHDDALTCQHYEGGGVPVTEEELKPFILENIVKLISSCRNKGNLL